MKFPSLGTPLLYAGGRVDMTKLAVVFHNFTNAPKKCGSGIKTVPPRCEASDKALELLYSLLLL
jgi:hypothetical protein